MADVAKGARIVVGEAASDLPRDVGETVDLRDGGGEIVVGDGGVFDFEFVRRAADTDGHHHLGGWDVVKTVDGFFHRFL